MAGLADGSPAVAVRRTDRRIAALDGLRGVAALLVLLHHVLLMLPDFANVEWRVPGAGPHGPIEWLLLRTPLSLLWAGQERALLFFVLSGFVLSTPWLDRRAERYGRFLLGRLCRIYPPYLLAMAAAAVGSFVLGGHRLAHASVYFNELGWAFAPSAGTLPSLVLVLNTPASAYMNEAIWSLVVELRVAVIFPLLMVAVVRWRGLGVVAALIFTLVAHQVTRRVMPGGVSALLNAPQETFYYAEYFLYGAAVALVRDQLRGWFARRHAGWGVACLAGGILLCWLPVPDGHDRLVGLGAAVIIAAAVGGAVPGRWLSARALLWLGRRSYSLYLTHVLVVMAAIIGFGGAVPVWGCAVVVAAAIGVAAMFHRWVELPSMRWAQRITAYRRPGPALRKPAPGAAVV